MQIRIKSKFLSLKSLGDFEFYNGNLVIKDYLIASAVYFPYNEDLSISLKSQND